MVGAVPRLKLPSKFIRFGAALVLLLVSMVQPAYAGTKAVGGDPPVIDQQPIERVISEGGHVTLSVSARGTAPLSYEWLKNDVPLPTQPHITGNAVAVLNIDPVTTNDSGAYSVVITNGAGAVTSAVAIVTVNRLGVGITVVPAQGGVLVRTFSLKAEVCRVESSNFGGPWMTNAYVTNYFGTPPEVFIPFGSAGNFFRARFDHMLPTLYPAGVGTMRAYGKLNQAWRFDFSDDLRVWNPLTTLTNTTGWINFADPSDAIPRHRFYRIAPP